MAEEKVFRLNCDVCDARNMREDEFEGYDRAEICADIIFMNERSRKLFERCRVSLSADLALDLGDEDVDVQIKNGAAEIKSGSAGEKKSVLIVNGMLSIAPGTQETLKQYAAIIVNGMLSCPKSLEPCLGKTVVNGKTEYYPDDCIILKKRAVIDRYFPVRAAEQAKYYAAKKVIMTDKELDAQALLQKGVRFVTPRVLVTEALAQSVLPMFDMETDIKVVPDSCCYMEGDVCLEEALVHKSGGRLYVDGDLILKKESGSLLGRMEYLSVDGSAKLPECLRAAFLESDAEYERILVQKENRVERKLSITVDQEMLKGYTGGICFEQCVKVRIGETVSAAQIRELLQFVNCAEVSCTGEQRSAVELVSENVAKISVPDDAAEKALEENGVNICVDVYHL